VNTGRASLNFSEWNVRQKEAEEAPKVVRNREMPPRYYVALHPEAGLTESERDLLANDLQAVRGPGNVESATASRSGGERR
jgi:hypothetical protein